jgi:hypothetical protein
MPEDSTKRKRGRPTKPAEERASLLVVVRMTAEEKAKWLKLGGVRWLRKVLNESA